MTTKFKLGLIALFCVIFATGLSAGTVWVDVTGYNLVNNQDGNKPDPNYPASSEGNGGEFFAKVGTTVDANYAVTNGNMWNLFCVDFMHPFGDTNPTGPGGAFQAYNETIASDPNTYVGALGSSSFIATSNSTINSLGGSARYALAGYLTTLYVLPSTPTDGIVTNTNDEAIQDAIWTMLALKGTTVLDQSFITSNTALVNSYLNQAATFYNSSAYSSFASEVRVFTEVACGATCLPGQGQGQEFVGVIPEPSTYLLLGGGLLALGFYRRRRAA